MPPNRQEPPSSGRRPGPEGRAEEKESPPAASREGGPAPAAAAIVTPAPAKLNLSLAVRGRRPDGYHEIESWVVQLDWGDTLRAVPGEGLALRLEGRTDGVPGGPDNLAWRAAVALAEAAGREPKADLTLEKRVPPGGGLGGGSSDAAATLRALNRLWGLDWDTERLLPVAAALGADVPLFLETGQAVLRGRGEAIERQLAGWNGWAVIVLPAFGLATAEVYRRWRPRHGSGVAARPWVGPSAAAAELMPTLFNDLEGAAFELEPRLARLHAMLDGVAGRRVRMTGSGSGLFSLFDTAADAAGWREAASRIADPSVRWKVARVV